jgi:hypothetical protein
MDIEQRQWTEHNGWQPQTPPTLGNTAQVLFVFGKREILKNTSTIEQLKKDYPQAKICGCSTAGEIKDISVSDDAVICTAVYFEHTPVKIVEVQLDDVGRSSFQAGAKLASLLDINELVHVFVLSDGLGINGSALAKGLQQNLPQGVSVTGGLAGDGAKFQQTLVISKSTTPAKDVIVAIGFYGKHLKVGYGSAGGWDPFGPERLITKSLGNILYQFDGHSALGVYKQYLGEHAKGLPATGLLFPLSIKSSTTKVELVRTILSVNENEQSMTFAGDIPQGSYARLMKANFDRLIDGAISAARLCNPPSETASPELALLISCVGRKLVLKQRVEEEVEGVREILGSRTALTGFYSYGEICPPQQGENCELHNQTMTITTFTEV